MIISKFRRVFFYIFLFKSHKVDTVAKTEIISWESFQDKEIWLLFKKGNRDVFAYIYHKHIHDLYNYGMKIRAEATVVEDCIQELFVELWEQRINLSITNNIKLYLYKALRIKLYRLHRRQISREKRDFDYCHSEEIQIIKPYEDLLIDEQVSAEKKTKLHKALGNLPPRQKEALTLLYFEKYSYEQAADIMAMNLRSVYTLAWKALSALRKAIK